MHELSWRGDVTKADLLDEVAGVGARVGDKDAELLDDVACAELEEVDEIVGADLEEVGTRSRVKDAGGELFDDVVGAQFEDVDEVVAVAAELVDVISSSVSDSESLIVGNSNIGSSWPDIP